LTDRSYGCIRNAAATVSAVRLRDTERVSFRCNLSLTVYRLVRRGKMDLAKRVAKIVASVILLIALLTLIDIQVVVARDAGASFVTVFGIGIVALVEILVVLGFVGWVGMPTIRRAFNAVIHL